MSKMPRVTNREEMEAIIAGNGPLGGERLVEYNIFLTDAFSTQVTRATFLEPPGPPDQIDGFTNDDSYRRSRHLLLRRGASNARTRTLAAADAKRTTTNSPGSLSRVSRPPSAAAAMRAAANAAPKRHRPPSSW